jgi:AraC-like DNA-binding protein
MAFFCWFGIILYVMDYDAFVRFNTFFFLALMLDQVLLYHFMFIITGTGNKRRFNTIHYIVPVILAVIMGVWSLLTPYEVQYYIVESRGENAPGYLWYSRFFSSTVPIFIIYNIIYPIAGFYRIRVYRREVVNYSADEYRTSVGWLYMLVFLILLTLPLASGVLFVHKSIFFNSTLTIIGALLPIFQYVIICYNLISGNYVIIDIDPAPPIGEIVESETSLLNRKRFEQYIYNKKPYKNSKLRIIDVAADLCTNRSYVSAFINKEYGMNFSRYINLRRLEELDNLRLLPENSKSSGLELVLMAGFSGYRSYLRVKKDENQKSILSKTIG